MDLNDLKDEIVSHLAEMSNLTVKTVPVHNLPYNAQWLGAQNAAKPEILRAAWEIFEDKEKAVDAAPGAIVKEASGDKIGTIHLEGTTLHYEPGYKPQEDNPWVPNRKPERILLANLVAPDSFDKAIVKLKHALNVLNICKPPKGDGLFGTMTPPFPMGF